MGQGCACLAASTSPPTTSLCPALGLFRSRRPRARSTPRRGGCQGPKTPGLREAHHGKAGLAEPRTPTTKRSSSGLAPPSLVLHSPAGRRCQAQPPAERAPASGAVSSGRLSSPEKQQTALDKAGRRAQIRSRSPFSTSRALTLSREHWLRALEPWPARLRGACWVGAARGTPACLEGQGTQCAAQTHFLQQGEKS